MASGRPGGPGRLPRLLCKALIQGHAFRWESVFFLCENLEWNLYPYQKVYTPKGSTSGSTSGSLTDTKTVRRIIRHHYSDGTTYEVTQSVTFKRFGVAESQSSIKWGAWISEGNGTFAAYTAPALYGYVAQPSVVSAAVASLDSATTYVDIYYQPVKQSGSTSRPASTSGHIRPSLTSQTSQSSENGQATSANSLSARQPAASVKEHVLPQTGTSSQPSTAMGIVTGLVASLGAFLGIGKKKKHN